MTSSLITQAIDLIKAGQKDQARQLLLQTLDADPHQETAWLWLVETLENNEQRIRVLAQCLKFCPSSQAARKGLERFRATPSKATGANDQSLASKIHETGDQTSIVSTPDTSASPSPAPVAPAVISTPAVPPAPDLHQEAATSVPDHTQPTQPVHTHAPLPKLEMALIGLVLFLLIIFAGALLFTRWIQPRQQAQARHKSLSSTAEVLETQNADLKTKAAYIPAYTPTSIPSPTSTLTPAPTATPRSTPTRTATILPSTPTPNQPTAPSGGQFVLQDSFTVGSDALSSVAFSPDGAYLAVGSADKQVYLLQTGQTTPLRQYTHPAPVSSLAFIPGGNGMAVAGGQVVYIWILDGGTFDVYRQSANLTSVALSPDFRWLASASENGEIKIFDNNTSTDFVLQEPGEPVWSLAFSTDSRTLAAGGEKIRLYDLDAAAVMLTIIPAGMVSSLAFSPSDPWLASGGEALEVWDTILGERIITLQGHTDKVWSVAFSPDGERLASASQDKTVRLWNSKTSELLQTLEGHTDSVNCVAFSPDGKSLASVGQDKHVKIWQYQQGSASKPQPTAVTTSQPRGPLANGKIAFISEHDEYNDIYVVNPDGSEVTRLTYTDDNKEYWPVWSPDGSRIAYFTYSPEHDGLNVMNADGSNPVMVADMVNNITPPSWSPDGQWLVFSSILDPSTNTLMQPQLYIVRADGSQLTRLTNNRGMDQFPVWSPDGQWIAFQSDKSTLPTVYVIHPDGSGQKMIGPKTCDGLRLSWSLDSQAVITECKDDTTQARDIFLLSVDGSRITNLTNDDLPDINPSWSPDGEQFLFTHGIDDQGNEAIFVMDADGSHRQRLATNVEPATYAQWSPDGRQLLFYSTRRCQDAFTMQSVGTQPLPLVEGMSTCQANWQPVAEANTSISTALPATPALNRGVMISPQNAVQLVELHRLTGHDDPIVGALAFSPDGSLLATGGNGRNVRLWDPLTGELLATLEGHTDNINSLVFSPDGTRLASGSSDKTIRIWDVATRQTVTILDKNLEYITCLAFSPDGRWLASGGHDGQVLIWDAETYALQASLPHTEVIYSLAFSPDNRVLAVSLAEGSQEIWFWSVPRFVYFQKIKLLNEGDTVNELVYSPDGRWLAAATVNQLNPTVRLLDPETGEILASLEGSQTLELNGAAFSPDGQLLASASADNSVVVWDMETDEPLITLWHESNANAVVFSPDGTLLATAGSDGTVRLWGVLP